MLKVFKRLKKIGTEIHWHPNQNALVWILAKKTFEKKKFIDQKWKQASSSQIKSLIYKPILNFSQEKTKQMMNNIKKNGQINQNKLFFQTNNKKYEQQFNFKNWQFQIAAKIIQCIFYLLAIPCLIILLYERYTISVFYIKRKQQKQEQLKRNDMIEKYTKKSLFQRDSLKVFKQYSVYSRIKEIFNYCIQAKSYQTPIQLITGPPGIGKSICAREIIREFSGKKNSSQKQTRIFYVNLKSTGQLEDNQNNQISMGAYNDLRGALSRLLRQKSERKVYNNVLVIDQINVVCRQDPRVLYLIRWLMKYYGVKIIALNSCSKSSHFFDSVINGYMDFENLPSLKKKQIKDFMKFKLNPQLKIDEQVLDQIGYRFTTIRDLSNKIYKFNSQYEKDKNGKKENSLNSQALSYFNPQNCTVNVLKRAINEAAKDLFPNQRLYQLPKNTIELVLINILLNLLKKEIENENEGLKIKSSKYLTQNSRSEYDLQFDFLKKLHQQNVVFGHQAICKNELGRLAIIQWSSQRLKLILNDKKSNEQQELATKTNDKMKQLEPFLIRYRPNAVKNQKE